MIYSIEGIVENKTKNSIIIKTNGLSYKIFVNTLLVEKIKPGQNIKIFTHLETKEDTIELYGFKNQQELEYFNLLKSISGIGPKSAINILSLTQLKDLETAILEQDFEILTKVSGIGTKIAQKIIIELKNKVEKTRGGSFQSTKDSAILINALTSMGYSLPEARNAIKKIPHNIKQTEKKIKHALKILSGR